MLGEWEPIYDTYAKELNISDNVKFMGQKANVQTYIVNASVFVSSSDFEGMSNSMLEAMAIGLPVVCTDCPIGGARMVIENTKKNERKPFFICEFIFFLCPLHITESNLNFFS